MGIVQVQELWNSDANAWRLPDELLHEPSLCLRNNYTQFTVKLKLSIDFPTEDCRFFRLMS